MLFKLSLKNIKKSIKDYGIYFFTLIFAVAMFYMFNSIDAQSSMLELNSSKTELIKSLVFLIGYVSVFVSIILGFLIVYSNNFLIRKRKKEIGLYFTLGMSKRKVSMILVIETILIGLVSLVVGLICGLFLSQFISIFTAKLFEVNMTAFKFTFSISAFSKTIMYFGLIFILVMIFNVITLSRYKLIDLLNASKKNEKVKFRNKYTTFISFILSIVLLGYAYSLLFDNALLMMNNKTLTMILCGSVGTFLLFFSVSGFLVKVIQYIKKVYYKDLNMFTLKQVNSKINTTVISTTIICLMLLLTIGILSGSMSMASVFNGSLKENNLTDYTVSVTDYIRSGDEITNTDNNVVTDEYRQIIALNSNTELDKYSDEHVLFHKYYSDDLKIDSLISEKEMKKLKKEYGDALGFDYLLPIMRESEYNDLMNLFGKKSIVIDDNQYIVLANAEIVVDAYSDFYQDGGSITLGNTKLTPATDDLIDTAIENFNTAGNDGIIVVSDSLVDGLKFGSMVLVGNYVEIDDVDTLEKDFIDFIGHNIGGNIGFNYRTKLEMEASSVGIKAIIIFMGLYLGITFAITSATVLAIGQLSEASDNKNRYRVLKQLGADNKMLNKSLFIQIAIPFIFPLTVALVHSYFGLKELNRLIFTIGNIDLTSNIVLTSLFIVIVYGGYFLITYLCSKNIIKEK